MNTELLLKVKNAILADAESFDIRQAAMIREGFEANQIRHECFTQACIAGWAVFLHDGNLKELQNGYDYGVHHIQGDSGEQALIIGMWRYFRNKSQRYLELNGGQALRLFHAEDWPKQFSSKLIEEPSTKEDFTNNAQTAADYIDYFIAHEGNV